MFLQAGERPVRSRRENFLRGTLAEPPPQNNEDHEPHDPLVEGSSQAVDMIGWRRCGMAMQP